MNLVLRLGLVPDVALCRYRYRELGRGDGPLEGDTDMEIDAFDRLPGPPPAALSRTGLFSVQAPPSCLPLAAAPQPAQQPHRHHTTIGVVVPWWWCAWQVCSSRVTFLGGETLGTIW